METKALKIQLMSIDLSFATGESVNTGRITRPTESNICRT